MAGLRNSLLGHIRSQLEDIQIANAVFIHCIVHQQALCGKDLDISHILELVVSFENFIRCNAFNHRQFHAFLVEIISDFSDLP